MSGRTAAALLAVAALAACGETEFDAEGFVSEANDRGAGLELGEPLLSAREETDVYAVEVERPSATGRPDGADEHLGEHEHVGGGSLIVAADADAAKAEFERCEGAVSLVCYRAANVVLALEGEPNSPELVGVDGAIRALASE